MGWTKIRVTPQTLKTALTSLSGLLFLALILRLSLVYWQYSGDIRNHLVWGEGVLRFGKRFFEARFDGYNQPNYPSVSLYLFALSAQVYRLIQDATLLINQVLPLFPSGLVNIVMIDNFKLAIFKLPPILADLGIGWLIFRLTPNPKFRLLLTASWLFNPAIIYVSTVWGQVESVPVLFLLASVFAVIKKRPILAHLFFAFAILSKQTALWLTPFYLVWFYQQFGLSKLLQGLGLQLVTFVLSFIPLGLMPIQAVNWYMETLASSSKLASDAAFNLWYWLKGGVNTLDSQQLGPLSIRATSWILVGGSFAVLLWRQIRNKSVDIFTLLFLASLVAFFFQTRVHERHLFPALVFLLLANTAAKPKLIGYALLSSYFLANLIWSLRLPFI